MEHMSSSPRAAQCMVLTAVMAATLASAQTRQQKTFACGPKPTVSVINEYGPVTLHAGGDNQVVVTYVLHSDKVEVDANQSGDRIRVESHLLQGSNSDLGRVDYEVTVPAGSSVVLESNSGPLDAENLRGDVMAEGSAANVDLRNISDGHIHVKTLSGNINLTEAHKAHVEISTLSGDVTLKNVDGTLVEVSSNTGKIHYDGDFGGSGSYKMSSHTGDIDASIPATASVDVTASSVKGQVDNDFPLQPKTHTTFVPEKGHSFIGIAGRAASSVFLHTFSGKIRLKQR
jgi:DUF4097 and DUF4098 domain-containing protein YvlB